MARRLDLLNTTIGRLKITTDLGNIKGKSMWGFACECGITGEATGVALKANKVKPCIDCQLLDKPMQHEAIQLKPPEVKLRNPQHKLQLALLPGEQVVIVIDGNYLDRICDILKCKVDFRKFYERFEQLCNKHANLQSCYYYINLPQGEMYSEKWSVIDWLSYQPNFRVIPTVIPENAPPQKFDVAIPLTIELIQLTRFNRSPRHWHFVLLTGNDMLVPTLQTLQDSGCRITLLAAKAFCDDLLRRQADCFVNFASLNEEFIVSR